MAEVFARLSQALVPLALGLVIGLGATWSYKYLLAEVEALSLEMNSTTLQLVNDLSRLT